MTSSLPSLYAAPGLPARLGRQVAKQHVLIEANAELVRHADSLRLRRTVELAQQSQMAVAQLSALEAVHAQAVPHAAPRLKQITDIATISIAQIVMESGLS